MSENAMILSSYQNQCVTLPLNADDYADRLAELQQGERKSGGS